MRSHAPAFLMLATFFTSSTAWAAEDANRLALSGNNMTTQQKAELEDHVAKNPGDIDTRTKLLGYYFIKGRQEPEARPARLRHVIWLIENAPESKIVGLPYSHLDQTLEPDAYLQAREAWLKAIGASPDKPLILKNAAKFFTLQDRKLSESLLLKGQALDSKDPEWFKSLGHLYALELISHPTGPERKTIGEKAYRQYEKAYELSDPRAQENLVIDVAKTALTAGLLEDARTLAKTMLNNDTAGWNRGNRIHHGNLILGQIALLEGDVAEAKSRLLLAGKTSGSPQLNSFGPNMSLAKELLERGESQAVLDYFELCRKFWSLDRGKLNQWADDVKAGRTPDFGGNLAY